MSKQAREKLQPKPRPYSKPGKELILKALAKDPKVHNKYKRKWAAGNEEKMLASLARYGHLQLRVKFELAEEGEDGWMKYGTMGGTTLVFKKIASQGSLLGIVEALTEAGVKEAEKWTKKRTRLD